MSSTFISHKLEEKWLSLACSQRMTHSDMNVKSGICGSHKLILTLQSISVYTMIHTAGNNPQRPLLITLIAGLLITSYISYILRQLIKPIMFSLSEVSSNIQFTCFAHSFKSNIRGEVTGL